jgi:hypothetical protein
MNLPKTCPNETEKDCQYERCGYWEDKEISKYAIKKARAIKNLGDIH